MNAKQVRALAEKLIAGPQPGIDTESFVRDALAESEAALKAHDSIGGERGQARFDDVMARLQATKFYRPTQTVIPVDRVGGSAGADVEKRHDAEVARVKGQNEQVLLEIGKVGVAAGVALTTGNPAAILPVLELLGRHLIEALSDDPEPATA